MWRALYSRTFETLTWWIMLLAEALLGGAPRGDSLPDTRRESLDTP